MELINSKEKHLRFMNEVMLGLVKTDEELGLLSEAFTSTSDPGFKEKEEKYIKYPFLKQRYDKLLDKGKTTVINKIEIVVNGGNLGNPTYSASLKTIDWLVANALAAYAVTSASPSEKTSIINFLTHYYNPYGAFGGKKMFSDAGFKAIPKNVEIGGKGWDNDTIMDFLSISYYNAINYLLKDGGYNPSPDNVFDFALFQMAWKQRFKNEMKDYLKRRGETEEDYSDESQIIKGAPTKDKYGAFADYDDEGEGDVYDSDPESEKQKIEPDYQGKYKSGKLTDEEKIAYLGSRLSKNDKDYINAWFEWYSKESGEGSAGAKQKIVDAITSGTEASTQIFAPKDETDQSNRMYDYISNKLGVNKNAATSHMSRMNERIIELIKDPEFIEKMGLGGFQKSKITRTGLFKGIKEMLERRMDKPQMLNFISEAKSFFNSDFASNKKMLGKIHNLNSIVKELNINEAYDVEVKDLDQEILGYLKYITESLYETGNILNELYKVHESIKFEYPEVSEKIAELIPPISEEVSSLIDKVNEVKKQMKPVLYNLDESKKKTEGELEEERLTNPDTKESVRKRENFIGSHIYGEDLGGLGKMYVAYSYGEQFPAYLWYKDKWYHNSDDYILDDGSVNEPTIQHKKDMRPSQDTHGMSTYALNSMIKKFKRKHGLGDNVHKDVEPGEKN